jgi:hypothetical protein
MDLRGLSVYPEKEGGIPGDNPVLLIVHHV